QGNFMRTKLRFDEEHSKTPGGLQSQHVRALHRSGFTIGGHTINHCELGRVEKHETLTYEIAEDKARLETMCGARLDFFAYPFGSFRNDCLDVVEAVGQAGYRGAVTTLSGFNDAHTNPFLLHRELTPALMSPWAFRARACGNYEGVQF